MIQGPYREEMSRGHVCVRRMAEQRYIHIINNEKSVRVLPQVTTEEVM